MFLEKLEVRALLGKGGHAWVYDCFDCFLERPVAVKAIKTLREAGRDLRRRAQAEAQVLANLAHPNLVRVIDAGVVGGLVYIVMEKLEGRTLRDTLMEVSRLSVRDALGIAIQIADGMQVAHSTGVIHRDLKPENIFIAPGNQVKVLDFGVAKVLGASHATTQKDRLQGTVLYMSPEQLQGVAVTPASDVFALGTMLFEMLYGHPLTLGGELPNNEHVAWMQLYKVPPPLESLDRKIPRYVGKLVGRPSSNCRATAIKRCANSTTPPSLRLAATTRSVPPPRNLQRGRSRALQHTPRSASPSMRSWSELRRERAQSNRRRPHRPKREVRS